jgi:integrase
MLTLQRRAEVSAMQWPELDDSGATWIIPAERYKTRLDHGVPLSANARGVVGEKPGPRRGRDGRPIKQGLYVFSNTNGHEPFTGYSKAKAELDRKIAELRVKAGRPPMESWVLHDLRRTGRSLLSRAGVPTDIAERVLGHVIPGVRGTYDRYGYLDEKRDALEKLATLIDRILEPPAHNVLQLRA